MHDRSHLGDSRTRVGDVQIVPVGELPQPVPPLAQVQESFSELDFRTLLAATGIVDRSGPPGVQDKVSAGMIALPVQRTGVRYILKLDPPEYPGVVEDEAFFLEPVALRDMFRQLVFAWLTGNGDVHAKNLSVLAGPHYERLAGAGLASRHDS